MVAYELIEQRYGFAIPSLYRQIETRGSFQTADKADERLRFYDCEWLSLEDIARYEFNSWEIAADGGFVPLAITGRHEPYCWRLDWGTEGAEPPIVICERSEQAQCLAPNLSGFLYRLAIEAFAGRNNIDLAPRSQREFKGTVAVLIKVLPSAWSSCLSDLLARPWRKDEKTGATVVLSWEEAEQIIHRDLAFPQLNESFIHDKDYLKRLRDRKS